MENDEFTDISWDDLSESWDELLESWDDLSESIDNTHTPSDLQEQAPETQINASSGNQNDSSTDELREQNYRINEESQVGGSSNSGCLIFIAVAIGVAWLFSDMGIPGDSFLALLYIIVIIAVFLVIMSVIENDIKTKENAIREKVKEEQREKKKIMMQVFSQAKATGFHAAKTVTDPRNRYCISIDAKQQMFLVKCEETASFKLYRFSDLIGYELSEDGRSTISSTAKDAAIGGILFGTTGAVVGASSKKDIDEYCSNISISLTVNDVSEARIVIPILSKTTVNGVSKKSDEYIYSVERAKEIIALLQLIQREAASHNSSNQSILVTPQVVESVNTYKVLLETGIITQAEFDAKRKELLHL